MTTIRQINGMMNDGQTRKLVQELTRYRADVPAAVAGDLEGSPVAAAALAAIRLLEIDQTHMPVFTQLLGRLLKTQTADGSWDDGDPFVTALAARALLGWPETRPAALRAIAFLTGLQRDDGSFPRTGPRRLPGDALATAFVLVQLAEFADFAESIRLGAALFWLGQNRHSLSPDCRSLARNAVSRSMHHIGGQARQLVELIAA
ncbi:MAG: hypothetical protein QM770_08035 [Tepidisphaeraceae bacterium]